MLPSQIHKVKGVVITLSGPSGVGKGTVITKLMEMSPSIKHSVSITTRKPRPEEIEGVDYYFTDEETFIQMIADEEILEHDIYCGNYYGTPRAPLLECIENGVDVILDITVPGSISVMERFPEAVSIFLLPPSFSELKRRLLKRGTESNEVQQMRLGKARSEVKMAKLFEYVLVNDDLEQTANSVIAITKAERFRYKRLAGIEDAVMEN